MHNTAHSPFMKLNSKIIKHNYAHDPESLRQISSDPPPSPF